MLTSATTGPLGDSKNQQPHLAANPGVMLAPKDLTADMLRPLANNEYDWRPERSPDGPITILISAADRTLYVYRNGEPIGRAAVEIIGQEPLGGHVFTLLEGVTEKPSWWAPNRPMRKWMGVASDDTSHRTDVDEIASRLRFSPEFATKLYDAVAPGTTVIVTDQPAVRKPNKDFTIMTN